MTSRARPDDEFDSSDFEILDEPRKSAEEDDGERKVESESEVQLNMASEKASTNTAQAERKLLAEERKKMEDMMKIHSKREASWTKEREKLIERNNCLKKENDDLKSKLQESVDSEKQKCDQLVQSMKELEEKATDDLTKKDKELEERDEELEQNVNVYKNKIQEKEDENAALVSKYEELKAKEAVDTQEKDNHIEKLEQTVISLKNDLKKEEQDHKSIIQEKEDEYAELTSKLEESSESEKKGGCRIKELEQNLKEEEKKYQELENINDDLEEKNGEWRKEGKETSQKKIKLQEQMNEMEKKSRENARQMQNSNEALKAKLEKLKNEKEKLEKNNEELDEENIAQKMKVRKLEENQELHAADIQRLAKKVDELTNTSDHYQSTCNNLNKEIKRLRNVQQQLKADFDTEKKKVKNLNRENEILRQRLDERPGDESSAHVARSGRNRIETKDNDLSHVMSTLSDVTSPTTGSSDYHQGSFTESTAPLNQANAQQWYLTEDGEKILSGIFQKLMEIYPLTELSRDINSQDIIIVINADQTIPTQVRFPSNFPNFPVQITCGDKWKNLKFKHDAGSSHADFVNYVVSTLSALM